MAYSNTVTVSRKGREIVVSISETEAAASSEADAIQIGVKKFRIHRQICVLTGGSGGTVDPIIGTATNPSGANVLLENDTAAATVDNSITGGVTCYDADGVLYHRSNVGSGADNSVSTEYHITVGW